MQQLFFPQEKIKKKGLTNPLLYVIIKIQKGNQKEIIKMITNAELIFRCVCAVIGAITVAGLVAYGRYLEYKEVWKN